MTPWTKRDAAFFGNRGIRGLDRRVGPRPAREMARRLRIEWAGACFHVINRGNYRQDIFSGDGAAQSFAICLEQAAVRFGWLVHAFVIMRNHFHLAVETPEPNLSEGMKWLQGTWAARFNRFRRVSGRPFQGRFKALHVEPGHALAQVAHYIHLNPVRAGVVPADRLPEFRWSSLPRFAEAGRPAWLEGRNLLAQSGGLPDSPVGWHRYLGYLTVLAEEAPLERERKFGSLSRSWAIGSPEFKSELAQEIALLGPARDAVVLLGAERAAINEARAEVWEATLQAAASKAGISLTELPATKSAPEKVRLAVLLKSSSSVSNAWLAQRLDMGAPKSVSEYVRRHLAATTAAATAEGPPC